MGRAIAVLRMSLGMKQGELAAKAGMAKSTLSACETGSSSPEGITLHKIFEGLGLPLSTLDDALDWLEWIESHQGASGAWRQSLLLRQLTGTGSATLEAPPGERRPPAAAHLRAAAAVGNAVAQNLLKLLEETETLKTEALDLRPRRSRGDPP